MMKDFFLSKLLLFIFSIFWISGLAAAPDKNERILGVKIYDYKGDIKELVKTWEESGINTVFAGVNLLSDDNFKKYTKESGIKTFVILPIFFDPEALAADTSLYAITARGTSAKEEWVEFVCPSNEGFINKKIEAIKEFVRKNDPDGISLDFIRHFVFWEMIYPERTVESIPNTCLDEKCISGFCAYIDEKLPADLNNPQDIFYWINENYPDEWIEYKCGLITNTVKKIVTEVKKIKPGILVNLNIIPWRKDDFKGAIKKIAGQDVEELAKYADYISPMTYSHTVKRGPEWIHSVVNEFNDYKDLHVLPGVQAGTAYLSADYTKEEFGACVAEALKAPSGGVVFWNWNALEEDNVKLKLVKDIIPGE
jgi:hypothetical protein